MGIVGTGLEQLVVAFLAPVKGRMKLVAEDQCAEIGYFNGVFLRHMASRALGKGEGLDFVMAEAARLPLVHIRHGGGRVLLGDVIEGIVTDGTVVGQFFQMDVVVEEDLAGVFGIEGDDLEFLGVQNDRNGQEEHEQEETSHRILLG